MPQIHMHENKVVHVFSFYRNYTVIHSYSTGAAQSEKPGLGNKKVSTSRNPPPPRTHTHTEASTEGSRKESLQGPTLEGSIQGLAGSKPTLLSFLFFLKHDLLSLSSPLLPAASNPIV